MSKPKGAEEAVDQSGAPCCHVQCALCTKNPCECPPFRSAEYFALIDKRHGR